MSAPVVFSYSQWAARYPELAASVGQPQAQQYFNESQLYCDNSATSVIANDPPIYERAMFLNMLTAHICALNAVLNNVPSSPLVGRISNGTEGSVSVATQNDYPPGTPQWYQQTKYGSAFWAGTAKYRTMRYVPGCVSAPNPWNVPYGR